MAYFWLLLFLFSGAAWAKPSAQITLVSDYTDEGVSQNNGEAAWIMGIENTEENGAYYGFRALQIDFGDRNQAELNTYAGYRWSDDTVSYDFGTVLYTYVGDSIQNQYDFTEQYFTVFFEEGHSIGVICSFDLPTDTGDITHCIATYGYAFPEQIYGFDTSLEMNYARSLDSEITPWGDKQGYLHSKLSFSRVVDEFIITVGLENTWWNNTFSGGGLRTIVGLSYVF